MIPAREWICSFVYSKQFLLLMKREWLFNKGTRSLLCNYHKITSAAILHCEQLDNQMLFELLVSSGVEINSEKQTLMLNACPFPRLENLPLTQSNTNASMYLALLARRLVGSSRNMSSAEGMVHIAMNTYFE